MKQQTNITLDAELKSKIKELNIRDLSKIINDFLWNYINTKEDNIDGINLELEKKKFENAEIKFLKWKNVLDRSRLKIQQYEERVRKQEENKLIKEKEEIKAKQRCINCGQELTENHKFTLFPKGKVCKACFMTSDKESIKRWSNGN
jgi:ribosomal protein S14